MRFFFALSTFTASMCIADVLNNNTPVPLVNVGSGSAKTTLTMLIRNENSAAKAYPYETKDLQTSRTLNRKVGFGSKYYQFNSGKSAALALTASKLSAKTAEINLKSGEDTSIVAHSDQISY